MMDNSGIFVVRSSNCSLLGGTRRAPAGLSPRHPGMSPSPWNLLRSPQRSSRGERSSAPPPARHRRDDTLLNKTVVIKAGQWKGYIGIVRQVTDTTARVELHTNSKLVTINRDMLWIKDEEHQPEFPPSTPSSWDMRTPLREDGSQTPMRTPLRYGLGTPATPVHGTAWDPTQPTTPRTDWSSDFRTPDGFSSISTPGFPATSYNSPYSPAPRHYDQSPNPSTPTGNYTPGYDTPGAYTPTSYSEATPEQSPYPPATPGEATPRTPGTPDVYEPMHEEHVDTDSNWHTTDILVKISGDFANGQYQDQTAVIKHVSPDSCSVTLSNGEVLEVPNEYLQPVKPTQKGNVKIIRGDLKGNTGVLIGIDGADGIVKMSVNLDIKILDLHHLAVMPL